MHTVRQKSEKNPDGRMRQGLGTFDKVNLVKPDKKPTKSARFLARFRFPHSACRHHGRYTQDFHAEHAPSTCECQSHCVQFNLKINCAVLPRFNFNDQTGHSCICGGVMECQLLTSADR